jgi:hypothetical protein
MGEMTRQQFENQLIEDLKNRADTIVGDTRIFRWIDYAYNHVSHPKVFRHRQLLANHNVTLATGINEYSISAATVGFQINAIIDVHHIAAIAYAATATKRKLYPKDGRWFDQRTMSATIPTAYAVGAPGDVVTGEVLKISGVPRADENGQIVIVRCWREPAILAADGTTTVLPRAWDEVISLGAKWRAERDLGYKAAAELTLQDYAALINDVSNREQIEGEDWGWEVDVVMEPIMETS